MGSISVGTENSTSIDLHYEDQGSGQPVVLVHGWPLTSRSWERQAHALLEAGHRVITYDRRGFGQSSRPDVGYDYDTFAADLHVLMTALDLRDVGLFGFSMGAGEVARYIGTYGTGRLRCAGLLSGLPPSLERSPDNPAGLARSTIEGIREALVDDRLAFLTRFFADFYNQDDLLGTRVSEEVVRDSWNVAAAASPRGTRACVAAWLTDFRDDLPRFDLPTLVVHGTADRVLPVDATALRI